MKSCPNCGSIIKAGSNFYVAILHSVDVGITGHEDDRFKIIGIFENERELLAEIRKIAQQQGFVEKEYDWVNQRGDWIDIESYGKNVVNMRGT